MIFFSPVFAPTGAREHHITGDIGFAVWQYWALNEDKEWLSEIGYPLLSGIAGT